MFTTLFQNDIKNKQIYAINTHVIQHVTKQMLIHQKNYASMESLNL
jgi:hypothetical protein